MIVLHVSLNFDPVKKLYDLDSYLTMKATILRKTQETVKTFTQLIFKFNHFSLILKSKKVTETMRKKQNTVTFPGLQQPINHVLGLEMWIVFSGERRMLHQMKNLKVLENVLFLLEL